MNQFCLMIYIVRKGRVLVPILEKGYLYLGRKCETNEKKDMRKLGFFSRQRNRLINQLSVKVHKEQ